jgi:hypothetical protein
MKTAATTKTKTIMDTASAWESGKLGREEEFIQVTSAEESAAIDDALGLQMISIRLPKALIEDLKAMARVHEVGYQPLMRDVLTRWVTAEKKIAKAGAGTAINQITSKTKKAA